MANRHLLHRSKMDAFKQWLTDKGYIIEAPKGVFEALRFRASPNNPPIIIHDRLWGDHFTAYGTGLNIVRRFISDTKQHGKAT
ncbi:hypothetical protein ABIB06_006574 [Bradyrhizobium sp. LB8.2]